MRTKIWLKEAGAELAEMKKHDEAYKAMWYSVQDAYDILEKTAKKVIIRKGVIDLYPAGDDRDKAINDCEDAKRSMLCAVGRYDGEMKDLKAYFSEHYDELDRCRDWNPARLSTSHEVVESVYEKMLKK